MSKQQNKVNITKAPAYITYTGAPRQKKMQFKFLYHS